MAMNGYHDNSEREEERGLEDMIKLEYGNIIIVCHF
jgi:hypothetical protein